MAILASFEMVFIINIIAKKLPQIFGRPVCEDSKKSILTNSVYKYILLNRPLEHV
jgi:hypothetical protein